MKTHAFTKKRIMVISICLVAAILVGTFFDYQISCALYHGEKVFGKIFAAYGQLPVAIGNVVIGYLLIYVTQRKLKVTTILAYIAAVYSYFMAIVLAAMDPMLYLEFSKGLAFGLAIVEVIAFSYLTHRLVQGCNKDDIKKYIGFLAFIIYGQLIIINVLKHVAARPRMRMIAVTPEAAFQPWYVLGSTMRDTLTATLGIATEEFKSFPSGHSGCAAVILAFSLVPYIRQKGSSDKWFFVGLTFALLVMFSRIMMGAHFLTDVTFGFTITFFLIVLGIKLFYGGKYE